MASSSVSSPSSLSPSRRTSTLSLFLVRTLDDLKTHARRIRDDQLIQSCDDVLESIHIRGVPTESDYIRPLLLSCGMQDVRVVECALDGIQKLVSFGVLDGRVCTVDGESVAHVIIASVCKTFFLDSEKVFLQLAKCLTTCLTASNFEVHDARLLDAFRTCFNIFLVSRSVSTQSAAKAAMLHMMETIFQKFLDPSYGDFENERSESLSETLRDGLHVFRSLCKLLQRPKSDSSPAAFLQSQVLALDLVHSLLELFPYVVGTNPYFIATGKKYLTIGLLRCILHSAPVLFQHALNVILIMFEEYRPAFRNELSMFFSNVLIQVLRGNKSTSAEKILVLQLLDRVCDEQDALVEVLLGFPDTEEERNQNSHHDDTAMYLPSTNLSDDEYERMRELIVDKVRILHSKVTEVLLSCSSPSAVPEERLIKSIVSFMLDLQVLYVEDAPARKRPGLVRSVTRVLDSSDPDGDIVDESLSME